MLRDDKSFGRLCDLGSTLPLTGDYEMQAHLVESLLRIIMGFKDPVERFTKIFQGNGAIAREIVQVRPTDFLRDSRMFLNKLNTAAGPLRTYAFVCRVRWTGPALT